MAAWAPQPRTYGPNPVFVVTVVLGVALIAWLLAIGRMHGMDDGPGTDLGTMGWFLGLWVTMMAAMMLPSAAPVTVLFARTTSRLAPRRSSAVATTAFMIGYLATWVAFGVVAYAAYRLVADVEDGRLAWDSA